MDELIDDDEILNPSYSWQQQYQHSLPILSSSTSKPGDLETKKLEKEKYRKEQLLKILDSNKNFMVRKGIIRYVFIVIDYSQHLLKKEYCMKHKIRHELINSKIQNFVEKFFDKNPLCQIGLIFTRNEKAEKIAKLSGNVYDVKESLIEGFKTLPQGEPSLENILILSKSFLASVPVYGSKEVLIVYSGIGSVDHGNIFEQIESVKKANVRCSVIGFGAKVNILEILCKETFGKYCVPKNEDDLDNILMSFTNPFNITKMNQSNHVKQCIAMGFPMQKRGVPTPCYCHKKLKKEGYFCPRCNTKYCNIPVSCKICNLFLINSFHLARSFFNLFPVKNFVEVEMKEKFVYCYGCQKELKRKSSIRLRCPDCKNIFCIECDVFIHQSLNNCPGCLI